MSSQRKPVSADEFLEQGSVDEESGNRWLGSDVHKALRFYDKAYESYRQAARRGSGDQVDIAYSAARLELHVYNEYGSEGMVPGAAAVLQPLEAVVAHHEAAVNLARALGKSPPHDLLYNLGQSYAAVVEELAGNEHASLAEAVDVTRRAYEAFLPVLGHQVSALDKFVQEIDAIDSVSEEEEEAAAEQFVDSEKTEATAEQVLQPNDVFDTVLACYKLAQALLENINEPNSQIGEVQDFLAPFLAECDAVAAQLLESFSEATNSRKEFLSSVSDDQKNKYLIAKTSIVGLTLNDLDQLTSLWNTSELPETAERYLVFSDNIQEILDRNNVSVAAAKQDVEMANGFWKALTVMTSALKKGQEILTAQKSAVSTHTSEGLGTTIANISSTIIRRADIDLQRCQLDNLESAQKHKEVLFKNCKVFLKNAMTMANTSGGLRERASEKILREHRKAEAVLRLCLLEGKTSVPELDEILGRDVWMREVPSLASLDYFEPFGVNHIGAT